MTSKAWMKYGLYGLFSLPLVSVLLFLSYLTRVVFMTGRIPTYNNPDPNSLDFDTHRMIIDMIANVTLIMIPFLSVLLVVLWMKKWYRSKGLWTVFAIGVSIFVWFLFFSDFGEWYFD